MNGPRDGVTSPEVAGSFRAGPIGKAASILVCVAALSQVLLAVSDWRTYLVFKDDLQSRDPGTAAAG